MKLLPRVLLILGGVALVGAIGVLSYGGFETWKQYIALSANRSMAFMNPVGYMIGGAALALLGGLLGGYALALPRGDDKLRLLVDATLAELYRTDRVKKIYARSFGSFPPDQFIKALFVINGVPK